MAHESLHNPWTDSMGCDLTHGSLGNFCNSFGSTLQTDSIGRGQWRTQDLGIMGAREVRTHNSKRFKVSSEN